MLAHFKKITRIMLLVLCGTMCVVPGVFAQKISVYKLTDSVYMLEGRGGNIGVSLGEDGILIIDTQYAPMAPRIKEAIAKLQSGDIDFIINTHFHIDHTGGNIALSQGAPIIAHDNVYTRMKKGKDLSDKTARSSLPTITYSQHAIVHFNDEDIQLTYYPSGHTDTDTVVYFPKANVLHTGDLFFNGFFPFVDIRSGGDVEHYMENLQILIDTAPKGVIVIPGHGLRATIVEMKAQLVLMQDTIAIIRKGMASGKLKKELQEEGLPKKYDSAGSGFVKTKRWISIVFDSYSR